MKTILVTGANGQLGSEIRALSGTFQQFDFIFTDQQELSVTDPEAVRHFFEMRRPDFCINCAAYTAVDKAESPDEQALVKALNADAVGLLATACTAFGAKLLHISTDYVFDGNSNEAYVETDSTNPVSMYGITKLDGEKQAQQYTDAIIMRTAWVYSSYGRNFLKTMIQLMHTRDELNVVCDQHGTPTYAADLALVILQIVASGKWLPGIYHYTNEGQTTWYGFASAIKNITGAGCRVNAVKTAAFPTVAKRPGFSVLNKSKVKAVYGIEIPNWEQSLKSCIKKLNA